jgi:hypothetical protein
MGLPSREGGVRSCVSSWLIGRSIAQVFGSHHITKRSAPLCRRDVTRGWPEHDRRQFDALGAGSALRCEKEAASLRGTTDLISIGYCLLHTTAFIHPLNIHCHRRIPPSFEHRT